MPAPEKRLFYGWWMVAAGFGLQFMQAGLLQQSFGAYVAILRDELGWSKTALSGAAVIQQVESALLGPIQGWFVDRFGPAVIIRFGIVMFGLGFILMSRSETLMGFYGAFLVIALGSGLSGFFPLTVSLVHWFERRRARALSLMQLGYAAGGMAVPIVALSMQTFGWRATAFASGLIIIAVGFPLASVIRRRPEDYGETIDGEPPAAAAKRTEAVESADYTVGEALRTPAFWYLSLGHGFALFVVSGLSVHAITHMKEGLGYTLGTASLVIGLMTMFQFLGIVCSGWLGDRFDKRLVSAGCMLFHMFGLLLLTFAFMPAMLVAFAVLHGFSWGMRGPLMHAMRADYFGRRAIGMILGLSSIIIFVGQVGGPLIAGALADATGDYRIGFSVLAALSGLGSVFFLLAKRPPSRIRPTAS
jgi:sugar phosphate permease